MKAVSNYWVLIRLDGRGKITVEEIAAVKTFIQEQFLKLSSHLLSDTLIQRHLWDLLNSKNTHYLIAQASLRCFISSQIQQVCIDLERHFGNNFGFTRYDLFPYVLDDTLAHLRRPNFYSNQTDYTPKAMKILQTFDPLCSNLSTWTSRLVKYDQDLNVFLRERGIYLISDWAILNNTSLKQLQRILKTFHYLSEKVIVRANHLLESYHAIYRQDRLTARKTGMKGKCQPPSDEQLEKIAALIGKSTLSPDSILSQLQNLAEYLRQYHVYAKGGSPHQESLDNPSTLVSVEQQQIVLNDLDDEPEHNEFLQRYRRQLLACLEKAIAKVVPQWISRHKSPKEQQFLKGLELFHCQGYSMTEIAPLVGLQAQYQVTRLLKLKDFRADIRQQMLQDLRGSILEIASNYTNPEQLQQQEQQIAAILDQQVATMISEAESEASLAKNRPLKSLFARYLCRYLNLRKNSL